MTFTPITHRRFSHSLPKPSQSAQSESPNASSTAASGIPLSPPRLTTGTCSTLTLSPATARAAVKASLLACPPDVAPINGAWERRFEEMFIKHVVPKLHLHRLSTVDNLLFRDTRLDKAGLGALVAHQVETCPALVALLIQCPNRRAKDAITGLLSHSIERHYRLGLQKAVRIRPNQVEAVATALTEALEQSCGGALPELRTGYHYLNKLTLDPKREFKPEKIYPVLEAITEELGSPFPPSSHRWFFAQISSLLTHQQQFGPIGNLFAPSLRVLTETLSPHHLPTTTESVQRLQTRLSTTDTMLLRPALTPKDTKRAEHQLQSISEELSQLLSVCAHPGSNQELDALHNHAAAVTNAMDERLQEIHATRFSLAVEQLQALLGESNSPAPSEIEGPLGPALSAALLLLAHRTSPETYPEPLKTPNGEECSQKEALDFLVTQLQSARESLMTTQATGSLKPSRSHRALYRDLQVFADGLVSEQQEKTPVNQRGFDRLPGIHKRLSEVQDLLVEYQTIQVALLNGLSPLAPSLPTHFAHTIKTLVGALGKHSSSGRWDVAATLATKSMGQIRDLRLRVLTQQYFPALHPSTAHLSEPQCEEWTQRLTALACATEALLQKSITQLNLTPVHYSLSLGAEIKALASPVEKSSHVAQNSEKKHFIDLAQALNASGELVLAYFSSHNEKTKARESAFVRSLRETRVMTRNLRRQLSPLSPTSLASEHRETRSKLRTQLGLVMTRLLFLEFAVSAYREDEASSKAETLGQSLSFHARFQADYLSAAEDLLKATVALQTTPLRSQKRLIARTTAPLYTLFKVLADTNSQRSLSEFGEYFTTAQTTLEHASTQGVDTAQIQGLVSLLWDRFIRQEESVGNYLHVLVNGPMKPEQAAERFFSVYLPRLKITPTFSQQDLKHYLREKVPSQADHPSAAEQASFSKTRERIDTFLRRHPHGLSSRDDARHALIQIEKLCHQSGFPSSIEIQDSLTSPSGDVLLRLARRGNIRSTRWVKFPKIPLKPASRSAVDTTTAVRTTRRLLNIRLAHAAQECHPIPSGDLFQSLNEYDKFFTELTRCLNNHHLQA